MSDTPPPARAGFGTRAVLWLMKGLLRLPYRIRVPLCGWITAWIIAPLAGYRARVRENLARILPDLPRSEVRRLMRAVPDNVGRSLIEIWSGPEFVVRAMQAPVTGLAVLEEARAAGRPVVLVTGHIGNYDAARAALIGRGFRIGALYRVMDDAVFNEAYVRAIEAVGEPMFPRGRRGMGEMLRFFKSGGMLAFAIDQHIGHGADLDFLGHTARTALSAAELALKYDALLVPFYGIRRPDGMTFDVVIEAPVPRGTAEEMTQALNDSLGALVRRHPEQWFWIHRRWKAPRPRLTPKRRKPRAQ